MSTSIEPSLLPSSSPFQTQALSLTISLLPSSLIDVNRSIQKQLNSMLLKYNNSAEGVILAHDRLKIEDAGKILYEFPQIHYKVQTRVLTFSPAVGMTLIGKVQEGSSFPSHVGLLVCDYFNAMVPADALVEHGFRFDHDEYQWQWMSNDVTDQMRNLLSLQFEVERVHECAGIISIQGINPVARIQ